MKTWSGCVTKWRSSRYSVGVSSTGFPARSTLMRWRSTVTSPKLDALGAGARGKLSVGPAERGVHAGEELAEGEGLDDVVVGAQLEPEHLVHLLVARGHHEDGQGTGLLRAGPCRRRSRSCRGGGCRGASGGAASCARRRGRARWPGPRFPPPGRRIPRPSARTRGRGPRQARLRQPGWFHRASGRVYHGKLDRCTAVRPQRRLRCRRVRHPLVVDEAMREGPPGSAAPAVSRVTRHAFQSTGGNRVSPATSTSIQVR